MLKYTKMGTKTYLKDKLRKFILEVQNVNNCEVNNIDTDQITLNCISIFSSNSSRHLIQQCKNYSEKESALLYS